MLSIQRRLTPSFYLLLGLPSTGIGFALSVQIAAMSWILSTKYGLSIEQVGFVWAAGPLAGIIGQLSIGWMSDNTWMWGGRRRPYLIIGGTLAALSLLALPNIGVISKAIGGHGILAVAMTVALVLDLSINVSLNPARAIIADVTPEGAERTKGFTWMMSLSGLFAVAAYGVGAIWDNSVLIFTGVLVVFILCIIPPFFIEEPSTFATAAVTPRRFSVRETLHSIRPLWGFLIYDVWAMTIRLTGFAIEGHLVEIGGAVLTVVLVIEALFERRAARIAAAAIEMEKVLAANAFSWIGVQALFVYLVAYAQAKLPAASDDAIGRVVTISMLIMNAMATVFPAFILEPLSERLGRVKVHAFALGLMALGYLLVALTGTTPVRIYAAMTLIGIGWAAIVSLPYAIMSEKIERTQTGLYMGVFALSIVLPQLVVSLGIGVWISQAVDKSAIFYLGAGSVALSAVCWGFVREPTVIVKAAARSLVAQH